LALQFSHFSVSMGSGLNFGYMPDSNIEILLLQKRWTLKMTNAICAFRCMRHLVCQSTDWNSGSGLALGLKLCSGLKCCAAFCFNLERCSTVEFTLPIHFLFLFLPTYVTQVLCNYYAIVTMCLIIFSIVQSSDPTKFYYISLWSRPSSVARISHSQNKAHQNVIFFFKKSDISLTVVSKETQQRKKYKIMRVIMTIRKE
jgi:hypothetical protein